MATATKFTAEQKEAWQKAKNLLKNSALTSETKRSLHIAMSMLRAQNGRKHKGPIEAFPKSAEKQTQHLALKKRYQIEERVQEWIAYFQDPGARKLYVLVNPDLSPAQKAVQAAHCVAKFQKDFPNAPWVNGTLVLVEPDQDSRHWNFYHSRIPREHAQFEQFVQQYWWAWWHSEWREPDMNNELTAAAILSDFHNDSIGQIGVRLVR